MKEASEAYLNVKVELTCVVHHTNNASFRWRGGGEGDEAFTSLRTADMKAGDPA